MSEENQVQVQVNDPSKYVGVPTKENLHQGIDAFAATADYQYKHLDFNNHTELGPEFIQ